MKEKKLTDENYKKFLDGVMEQAEKDFGEVVVENMFDEAVIDTLKEMAIKHSNDSYVYRVLVNAINLIQGLKDENESFGETINQASETLRKQKAEIERLTEENGWLSKECNKTTIECAELQKQVDEFKQRYLEESKERCKFEQLYNHKCHEHNIGLGVQRKHWEKKVQQAVKDTAKEILEWLKSEVIMTEIPHGSEPSEEDVEAVMWWQIEEHFKKRYGVEVE